MKIDVQNSLGFSLKVLLMIPALTGSIRSFSEELPFPLLAVGLMAIQESKLAEDKLVGFEAAVAHQDGADVLVFEQIPGNLVRDQDFHCDYLTDAKGAPAEAVCIAESTSDPRPYTAARGALKVELLEESLEASAEIFKEKIAPLAKIESLKAWKAFDVLKKELQVQIGFQFKDQESTLQKAHFYCHHHGHGGHEDEKQSHEEHSDVDCHRQRVAGPFEP